MCQTLTLLHNFARWFVLIGLIYAIFRAYRGVSKKLLFTPSDNTARHWAATLLHVQLVLGIILYSQSPVTKFFWNEYSVAKTGFENFFFALIHPVLMLVAIVVVTIGSALAKRKREDQAKFRTMLTWFSIGLVLIFLAVPWPFSPFAHRPLIR